jgi:putative ABC transport system permease protein
MSTAMQDLRHAVRALLKQPGYLATALLTLALGIGFTTATFSVVNAVLLRPLPFANPDALLLLSERHLPQFPEFSVSPGHYVKWREQATLFEAIAAWANQSVNLDTGRGDVDRVRADRVSANLFPLLGVRPLYGRLFVEADDDVGASGVAILTYGAWQRRFGGRGDVVGQRVLMDQRPYTIVGVMPGGIDVPSKDTEIWVALSLTSDERRRDGSHYMRGLARMKAGVTLERARQDLNAVADRIARADSANAGWEIVAEPYQAALVQNVRPALLVLLAAVSMVLLIACVNVANLLLARGAARQKELAIRAAVGASRARLVRQLLVEQVTLAVASAAGGVLVAAWLLRALLALLPNSLPRQAYISLDGTVLSFAVLLAVITPVFFGLIPALQVSRPDLRELLASGGRQGSSVPARRLRRALVIGEITLAMVLLVDAGLLIRSFENLSAVSPGFRPSHAISAVVSVPEDRYAQGEPRQRFFEDLMARVSALPDVSAVGLTQSVPMVNDYVSGFEREGHPTKEGETPVTNFYAVSSGYFDAMGIPIVRGRVFTRDDRRDSTRVIVINKVIAEKYFPGEDPLGQRMKVSQGPDDWREIVGIVGDVKQYSLNERPTAQVYEPYQQHLYFSGFTVVVRTTATDATAVVPPLRGIVRSLDARVPLWRVRTLDDIVDSSIRSQRFSATLIAMFSAAALLLAAIGVYGVVSYTVGLRAQEFAIRVAHGAGRSHILGMVLRNALSMALIGVLGGLVLAYGLRGVLERLLFGIAPDDGATYVTVALMLTTVSVLASVIPALRATRVDPVSALRGQ